MLPLLLPLLLGARALGAPQGDTAVVTPLRLDPDINGRPHFERGGSAEAVVFQLSAFGEDFYLHLAPDARFIAPAFAAQYLGTAPGAARPRPASATASTRGMSTETASPSPPSASAGGSGGLSATGEPSTPSAPCPGGRPAEPTACSAAVPASPSGPPPRGVPWAPASPPECCRLWPSTGGGPGGRRGGEPSGSPPCPVTWRPWWWPTSPW